MVSNQLDVILRHATPRDEPFLRRMLWLAAHWRDSAAPSPDPAVAPALKRYTKDFGRRGDCGLIASWHGSPIGAAWCRLLARPTAGYGYVSDDVPELSIAILPEYRAQGVGGKLIERLLSNLAGSVDTISLSVEVTNPARLLYERHGFATFGKNGDALTMTKCLAATGIS